MRDVAIVTLSGYADIFEHLADSIDKCGLKDVKIVVADRDLTPKIIRPKWAVITGVSPFCFAANANLGIQAVPEHDVLLTNDDVTFLDPETVWTLQHIAYNHPEVGILSPTIYGGVGNQLQIHHEIPEEVVYSEQRLAFVCVFLRREILDEIGPLDERFTGYGGEDTDYNLRAQILGYKLGVTSRVRIAHGYDEIPSTMTYRRAFAAQKGQMAADMEIVLSEKWKRNEQQVQMKWSEATQLTNEGITELSRAIS